MSPGEEERRPRQGAGDLEGVTGSDTVTITRDPSHASLRGYFWRHELPARRRASRLLDEILGCDACQFEPSDFGLTGEERIAEARRLVGAGWDEWEIRARLTRVPQ